MALEEESTIATDILSDSFNSSSTASLDLDRPFDRTDSPSDSSPLARNSSLSKLNALAPSFAPLNSSGETLVYVYSTPAAGSTSFHPVQNHFVYAPVQFPPPAVNDLDRASKCGRLTEDAAQKLVNQVEFYFSDLNLATTDHLIKHMLKDPEGYVPISMVASFKKIKTLIGSPAQLARILWSSTKLVVSEDGKKVKRKIAFTETHLEELQSRIVIAENLPEDHCHQNLMKIFSAVGSVKTIRTCQPQSSNGGASSGSRTAKSDRLMYSNKLHAFVEYESVELAERAVAELNDEDNWKNGLKVRLLFIRCTESLVKLEGKKSVM